MIIAGAKISEYIDNKQKKIIMAFKMTPGIRGNSASNSIMGGGCGGNGQPPCPPRFQAEKNVALVADRSFSSRSKSTKAKIKQAPVKPAPAPAPVKLKINLPKGHEFVSKREEMAFFDMFEQAISTGEFKTQEELDMAIMKQLKGGGPKDPKDPEGPIIVNPKEPGLEVPIKGEPIKGGGEFEAVPVKGVNAVKGK